MAAFCVSRSGPERVRVWVYRAELAMRLQRPAEAAAALLQVYGVTLQEDERHELAMELRRARELESELT